MELSSRGAAGHSLMKLGRSRVARYCCTAAFEKAAGPDVWHQSRKSMMALGVGGLGMWGAHTVRYQREHRSEGRNDDERLI